MRPSNQLGQRIAGDVRGAGAVAEGWELYQSRSHGRGGSRAVETLANAHRLRERIERARNANLNS
jgi:hypothetical protein